MMLRADAGASRELDLTVVDSDHASAAPTVLAARLFTPVGTPRRVRRAAARSSADLEREARAAQRSRRREGRRLNRLERHAANYLPRSGERGEFALRSYRELTVAPHRATSDVLAGAYPFLAEAGLGSGGILIGQDAWAGASFCFDPWVLYREGVLTNPNCLLAGVVGRGKSTLAKAMAVRSIAFGRQVYVPCDPKGEWSAVSRRVGGQVIRLGAGLPTRLNPLDEGPRGAGISAEHWRDNVTARRRELLRAMSETILNRPLNSVEATALTSALDAAVRDNAVPLLPHVVDALIEPPVDVTGSTRRQLRDDGRLLAHALNRLVRGDLSGLFDRPSTTRFDPSRPMVSLDLSSIADSGPLVALVMTCASTWMEAALNDAVGPPRWVIYDEAWRLLQQAPLLARMRSQWKLSRALGIANLMIIHRLSDLDSVGDADSEARNLALGLLADCSTKIIYAQESGEATKTAAALGLSCTEANELPQLGLGEGLWHVGERAFVVRHLCTPGELDLFDTNARMRG